MHPISFKQLFGAFFVIACFLLLLIIAVKLKDNSLVSQENLSANLNTTLSKPLDSTGEYTHPPTPGNIISGAFNPKSKGNVVYYDEKNKDRKFHYKAVRSDKLKDRQLQPKLKLELQENGAKNWKDTDWSWIDYDQGILYFHYKTEENGTDTKPADYTGNYQLILQED